MSLNVIEEKWAKRAKEYEYLIIGKNCKLFNFFYILGICEGIYFKEEGQTKEIAALLIKEMKKRILEEENKNGH